MTDEKPVRVYIQLCLLYSTRLLQERGRANNLFLQLKINTARFRKTLRKGFFYCLFFFLLGNTEGKCPDMEASMS